MQCQIRLAISYTNLILIVIVVMVASGCRSIVSSKQGADVMLSDNGRVTTRETMRVQTPGLFDDHFDIVLLSQPLSERDHYEILRALEVDANLYRNISETVSSLTRGIEDGRQRWIVSQSPLVIAIGEREGNIYNPRGPAPMPLIDRDDLDEKMIELVIFSREIAIGDEKVLKKMQQKRDANMTRIRLAGRPTLGQLLEAWPSILEEQKTPKVNP